MVADEQSQVDVVVRRLAADVDLPLSALESEVRARFRAWEGAPVRDYVPIFVERELRKQLLGT